MADGIKVLILEKEFAGLCRLGLPVSLCLQLQQSGLKLADALWTAKSSGVVSQSAFFGLQILRPPNGGEKEVQRCKTGEER